MWDKWLRDKMVDGQTMVVPLECWKHFYPGTSNPIMDKYGINNIFLNIEGKSITIIPGPEKGDVRSQEDIYDFWISRTNGGEYVDHPKRSRLVFKLVASISENFKRPNILEVGSNVGRNLNLLYGVGFSGVSGIEINPYTIHRMRSEYPNLKDIQMYCGSIEKSILEVPPQDIIIGMAVFEHLKEESVFPLIQAKGKYVISVSDEVTKSPIHFPRNMGEVFKGKELVNFRCNVEDHDLNTNFITRVIKCQN